LDNVKSVGLRIGVNMQNCDLVKYFKDLGCDYYYEYDSAYGTIDFKGKDVIMVGAGCGSATLYFLLHGSSRVIQYEKSDELRKKWLEVCNKFNICDKAVMNGEWKLQYDDADIFIIDCEGCEENINFDELKKYKLSCVAVHEWTKNRVELLKKMKNWKLNFVSSDGKEIMLCNS